MLDVFRVLQVGRGFSAQTDQPAVQLLALRARDQLAIERCEHRRMRLDLAFDVRGLEGERLSGRLAAQLRTLPMRISTRGATPIVK